MTEPKRAFLTGTTGQDGSYPTELLLVDAGLKTIEWDAGRPGD